MTTVEEDAPAAPEELSQSEIEARADAADVSSDLAYRTARRRWRPGNCRGFIVNTSIPVARLAWPKGRDAKDFLTRLKNELGKMPPVFLGKRRRQPRQSRATRKTIMSNDVTVYDNSDDGFGAAADEHSETLLRGDLLKCTDGHWSVGKDGSLLAHDTRLVCIGVGAAWVKWQDNKPTEYRVRRPGERLPEREELGDMNAGGWELGPDGQPRDPWQNTRFAWFVHPHSAAAYTFSTASWGGRGAVVGLGDQVMRMRVARPGVNPVVEFDSGPHKTKYGMKRKPILRIVGWVGGTGEGVNLKAIGKPAPKVEVLDDMENDSIPFD
jgi:hypothetical protein